MLKGVSHAIDLDVQGTDGVYSRVQTKRGIALE